jgi:caffeoyl-CoA O-methyltransferase
MADSTSRTGASYATREVMDYCVRVHATQDAALVRAATLPDGMPAIQVAPSEGRLLELLLRMIGARKIVEVGTLAGYSAICMARALPDDGHVWSIEYEPRHAEVARGNLQAAGLASRATVIVGAGTEMLPTLVPHGPFDAVFIDADKGGYADYGAWAIANLRRGGLVLGDNAYLFGRLTEDSDGGRAMRRFHELVAAACDSVCAPTPDGLVSGIKR